MKTREPITLTGDEAATMRYLVSKLPWARYIRRPHMDSLFYGDVMLLEGASWEAHVAGIPLEMFPLLRECVMYEICIDEEGTVRLYEYEEA